MGGYEWDLAKEAANVHRRGIDFREAMSVFDDPGRLEAPDEPHSLREARWLTIGWSDRARLLVVVTSERDPLRPRIISAWRATKRERDEYLRNR